MIKDLKINRFRGFKTASLGDFAKFNLFVGRNNSGKTSLLESLFLMIAPSNTELALKVNSFRGLTVIQPSYWSDLFYRSDQSEPILFSATVKVGSEDEDRVLRISPSYSQPANNSTASGSSAADRPYGLSTAREITGLKWHYEFTRQGKKTTAFDLVVGQKGSDLEGTRVHGFEEPLKGAFLNPHTMLVDVPTRFSQVVIDKGTDEVVQVLQRIDSTIQGVQLANNIVYCDVGGDKLLPVNLMGGGIHKALSLLVAIHYCKNGILLIDEIENGLHHTSMEVVWRAVIQGAYRSNVQIFATTHSYECIGAYNRVVEDQLQLTDDFRLSRCERDGETFRTVGLERDDVRIALEKNWEIR